MLTIDPQVPGHRKPVTGSTFEEVLYGDDPDSEAEGDDEDDSGGRKKRGGVHGGARLRIDNDQPMDLLESAVTQMTSELKPKSATDRVQHLLSKVLARRRSANQVKRLLDSSLMRKPGK